MDFLKGKKTYLIAVAVGLLAAAKALGYIDDETVATLTVLLGGGGLATLRAGMASAPKP